MIANYMRVGDEMHCFACHYTGPSQRHLCNELVDKSGMKFYECFRPGEDVTDDCKTWRDKYAPKTMEKLTKEDVKLIQVSICEQDGRDPKIAALDSGGDVWLYKWSAWINVGHPDFTKKN